MTRFAVVPGDVTLIESDLLVLKYAQAFYGADLAVVSLLAKQGLCQLSDIHPRTNQFVLVDTKGAIAARRVLFIGVPSLHEFQYSQMQEFAHRAAEIVATERIPARSLTLTVHGSGIGLDAAEALQHLVRGFQAGPRPPGTGPIDQVSFVEQSPRRARILAVALEQALREPPASDRKTAEGAPAVPPGPGSVTGTAPTPAPPPPRAPPPPPPVEPLLGSPPAQTQPEREKPHVFVAMPYDDEGMDVYEEAILGVVRDCGYICEMTGQTSFAGEIMERVRRQIETARLVIANLNGARPNVYLEVGYAWGKGVPVVFVAKKGEQLHFDVHSHRCVFYGRFKELRTDLAELLRGLGA